MPDSNGFTEKASIHQIRVTGMGGAKLTEFMIMHHQVGAIFKINAKMHH